MNMNIQIIAELAQGFEGCPQQARLLMKAAAAAGADVAKYQLVYVDEVATPDYKYYDLLRSLEMADDVWIGLADYARELGIQLNTDIYGTRSLRLAERIGVSAVKLHGTDIANMGLLNEVAGSSVKKVLLGAGGAYFSELQQAIDILSSKEIVILLGFQGYPTPIDANQIDRVRLLVERIVKVHSNVTIGFADHAAPSSPLSLALAAVALGAGARVFEKHLTLGEIMKLEDYEAALNPDRFYEFSTALRECADAYGVSTDDPDFGMSEAENGYRKMIRRHVVTKRALQAGTRIDQGDVLLKRSAAASPLTDLNEAYGATVKRDMAVNEALLPSDLSNNGVVI